MVAIGEKYLKMRQLYLNSGKICEIFAIAKSSYTKYIYINIYRILKKLRRLHNLFKIARISQFVGNGEIFQNLRQLYIYIYVFKIAKISQFVGNGEIFQNLRQLYIYIYICVQNCEDFAICGKITKSSKNCENSKLRRLYINIYIYAICSKLRRFRNKLRKLNIYAICSKLRRFRNLLKIAMISQNLKYIFFVY